MCWVCSALSAPPGCARRRRSSSCCVRRARCCPRWVRRARSPGGKLSTFDRIVGTRTEGRSRQRGRAIVGCGQGQRVRRVLLAEPLPQLVAEQRGPAPPDVLEDRRHADDVEEGVVLTGEGRGRQVLGRRARSNCPAASFAEPTDRGGDRAFGPPTSCSPSSASPDRCRSGCPARLAFHPTRRIRNRTRGPMVLVHVGWEALATANGNDADSALLSSGVACATCGSASDSSRCTWARTCRRGSSRKVYSRDITTTEPPFAAW